MAYILLASLLLGMCVLIAGAVRNDTDVINPTAESRPDILPHVSLQPTMNKTSGPELSPLPDIDPSSEPPQTENISMTTDTMSLTTNLANQTMTSAPVTQEPSVSATLKVKVSTSVLVQSTPTPRMVASPSTTSKPVSTVQVTIWKKSTEDDHEHVSIAVFLAVPVCIGLLISFFILFGKYCRKKLRLDKLRHQLMPMYSFDPAEGEDWETELLTDPRTQVGQQANSTQAQAPKPTSQPEVPQLRFAADV